MKRLSSFVLVLLLLLLVARFTSRAQSVGIGTAAPNAKAALDIRATDRGLLIPRLTAAQRTAIAAPPQGLMVYQTDAPEGFYYFGGSPGAWVFLNPAGGGADNLGNHTATQPLNLQAQPLVGTGADVGTSVGLGVRADGGLNLGQNTLGNNVSLGYQAGTNTTFVPAGPRSGARGNKNQFVGYQSGYSNTTGYNNLFSGHQSGYFNTTGHDNLFSGYRSGYSNTTGSGNTFSGNLSGYFNTTGNNNLFNGIQSGEANTTGYANQFEGYQSGISNTTGTINLFSGYQSGFYNTTGNDNQFSGYRSGFNNTTGSENYFSGYESGINNTTGSNNWAIGYGAGPTTGNLTNAGAIGYGAQVSNSNSLVLGGLGANAVNVGIGTSSPSRRLDVNGSGLFRGDVAVTGNVAVTGSVGMGWTQVVNTSIVQGNITAILSVDCPSGMRVMGGGGGLYPLDVIAAEDVTIAYNGPYVPSDRTWVLLIHNNGSSGKPIRVYCNCARIGP